MSKVIEFNFWDDLDKSLPESEQQRIANKACQIVRSDRNVNRSKRETYFVFESYGVCFSVFDSLTHFISIMKKENAQRPELTLVGGNKNG